MTIHNFTMEHLKGDLHPSLYDGKHIFGVGIDYGNASFYAYSHFSSQSGIGANQHSTN